MKIVIDFSWLEPFILHIKSLYFKFIYLGVDELSEGANEKLIRQATMKGKWK